MKCLLFRGEQERKKNFPAEFASAKTNPAMINELPGRNKMDCRCKAGRRTKKSDLEIQVNTRRDLHGLFYGLLRSRPGSKSTVDEKFYALVYGPIKKEEAIREDNRLSACANSTKIRRALLQASEMIFEREAHKNLKEKRLIQSLHPVHLSTFPGACTAFARVTSRDF